MKKEIVTVKTIKKKPTILSDEIKKKLHHHHYPMVTGMSGWKIKVMVCSVGPGDIPPDPNRHGGRGYCRVGGLGGVIRVTLWNVLVHGSRTATLFCRQ